MDRRAFLAGSGALLATPLAAGAQQAGRVHRIAFIVSGTLQTSVEQGPFFERLRELGWTYGRDVVAERRAYGEQMDRVSDLATDLMQRGPVDVFVVEGATEAGRVQDVTREIPIVATRAGDLVEAGLATSLARPGGNVTGIQTLQPQIAAKELSLLKEVIPRLTRSGMLFFDSASRGVGPIVLAFRREAEAGAQTLGITLQNVTIHGADELEAAFAAFQAGRAGAVVVIRNQFLSTHQQAVVDAALKHRLPTISELPRFATQGGLMAYGFDFRESQRSAAEIVDRILRGTKAGEIPVQQVTKFQLVINLKTAKALGLTIPHSVLLRADQVIE